MHTQNHGDALLFTALSEIPPTIIEQIPAKENKQTYHHLLPHFVFCQPHPKGPNGQPLNARPWQPRIIRPVAKRDEQKNQELQGCELGFCQFFFRLRIPTNAADTPKYKYIMKGFPRNKQLIEGLGCWNFLRSFPFPYASNHTLS